MAHFLKKMRLAFVFGSTILLFSCPTPQPGPTPVYNYEVYDYFSLMSPQTITFSNLAEGDRLLVLPLNTIASQSTVAVRSAFTMDVTYTGGSPRHIGPLHPEASARTVDTHPEPELPDIALEEDVHTPPVALRQTRGARATDKLGTTIPVNTVMSFYVINDMTVSPATYSSISAANLYEGTRCHVFFSSTLTGNANTPALAAQIGQAFDSNIYGLATSKFGFEFGGDPAIPAELGGVDGDDKIFILIQDTTLGCGGYYRSSDSNPAASYSNSKEIIYIVRSNTQISNGILPFDVIAHEFHHMINYNQITRRLSASQWPIVNEGFSQVCESMCGYGPDIAGLHNIQDVSRYSYSAWHFTGLPYDVGYAYNAGYAVMEYALRRFGNAFTNAIYDGSRVGIDGVEDALASAGYTKGYRGLVLDMLTAHYLDSGVYRYPAAGLYTGDIGIDLDSATARWYYYPPYAQTGLLRGLNTKFYNTYPVANVAVSLYDYGADAYEFASGANGTIAITLTNVQPNTVLRVVRLKAAGRDALDIDGRSVDWEGLTYASGTDPQNDNDLDSSTYNPTGDFGYPGADITAFRAYTASNVLYALIQTQTAPETSDSRAYFYMGLDLNNDGGSDYYLYFRNGSLTVYQYNPWQQIQLDLSGTQYAIDGAIELRLPLGVFGNPTSGNIRLNLRTASNVSGNWRLDLISPWLSVPRP